MWTYCRARALVARMESDRIDPETARLINVLLTRLGMLMEDATVAALLNGNLAERIRFLDAQTTSMRSICVAAKAHLHD